MTLHKPKTATPITITRIGITVFFGGEKGIRTLVGGLLQTRFPVVRLRPAQPSLHAGRYSPSRGTHTRDLCILPHIAGFVKRFSEKCGEEVDS